MIFTTNEKYEQALLSTLIHIQTNLEDDLSLELLTKVGFSAYHFHRLFRDAISEPVKEYVRRLRLEKAAYRLNISEEAILRHAMDSGFKTHESFTRAFQRQFGITPNEYRNNFLKASRARKKQVQPKYITDYNSMMKQDCSRMALHPSRCMWNRCARSSWRSYGMWMLMTNCSIKVHRCQRYGGSRLHGATQIDSSTPTRC